MSKRQINKQQSARIQKIQANYRQLGLNDNQPTEDGLVITRFSKHACIEDSQGNLVICSIRPNIDSLIAGDRVIWLKEGKDQGVVVSRYPRQSMLGRPNKQGVIKPIAANITQMMITVAPKPEISWPLLDSYLVIAEYLKLKATIVLNKVDLSDAMLQQTLINEYQALYPLIFTSCEQEIGLESLQQALNNQTSVFVGQSGVGKSSLIRQLLPREHDIQVQAISSRVALGKHTTSNSCLYHLALGGALIDSPGVREFSLWHMPLEDITSGYKEFRPYLNQCKFRNCNHRTDQGCALTIAANNGAISRNRYQNYVTIAAQMATK